ncbi:hypothetical protein M2253_002396 [Leucobacter luti]|nr:hypothetical protein [Leucobacter luti]
MNEEFLRELDGRVRGSGAGTGSGDPGYRETSVVSKE